MILVSVYVKFPPLAQEWPDMERWRCQNDEDDAKDDRRGHEENFHRDVSLQHWSIPHGLREPYLCHCSGHIGNDYCCKSRHFFCVVYSAWMCNNQRTTCFHILVISVSQTTSKFKKQTSFLILDFMRKCFEKGIQYVVRETLAMYSLEPCSQ